MIKTTGDIFKKFWDDSAWWNHMGVTNITGRIDGVLFDERTMAFSGLSEKNSVVISTGGIYDGASLSTKIIEPIDAFFDRWLTKENDKQYIPPITLATSHAFTVTIPHENYEIFLQMVKNVGGTVRHD